MEPRFTGPAGNIARPDNVDLPPPLPKDEPFELAVLARGARTPLANSAQKTWDNYLAGVSGIVRHSYPPYSESRIGEDGREIQQQIYAGTAGTIKDFDPIEELLKTGIVPRKQVLYKLDPFAQYALAASFEALSAVRTRDGVPLLIRRPLLEGIRPQEQYHWTINPDLVNPLHVGVEIGTGFGGGDVSADSLDTLRAGQLLSLDYVLRAMSDRAASIDTQAFGITGGASIHTGACASEGKAGLAGINKILTGKLEVALIGGTEGILHKPMGFAMFDSMPALDRGTDPDKVSRALHKERYGFTMGEGSVMFVISTMDFARRHGIPILHKIVGYGDTSDAGDDTNPSGVGGEQAMRMARRLAERSGPIEGKIIVSGHLTGTPAGDGTEMLRIANVLDDHRERTYIFGSKGQGAHMLGAAGGLSNLLAGFAVEKGIIPGTHFSGEKLDEGYGWNLPEESRPDDEITDALINQFGFGGANVSLWLRRA